MSSWYDGAFSWVTHLIGKSVSSAMSSSYVDPSDNDEDDTSQIQYKTVVSYSEPLRSTKCLFVSEMSDFFTESELESGYHTRDEYDESLTKYGFIYKTQKFDNADTPQKLLNYATDWIKNNYHGGLTSFTITALDMHLAGNPELDKYMVGKRVRVRYPDPVTKEKTERVLTIISAEYDLYNPEKDSYKIGIPDITLSKVYGETSKKGGGGGSGKNTSSENDAEDGTTMEGLADQADSKNRIWDETGWAHLYKVATGTDDPDVPSSYSASQLQIPIVKDPGGDFLYTFVSDFVKTGDFRTTTAIVDTKLKSKYIVSEGAVEAKKVEADEGNVTTFSATDGLFDNIEIGGKTFSVSVNGEGYPQITIDGTTYTLELK